MPIDFNEEDLQEVIEQQTEQTEAEGPSEVEVDQQMSEVESRLEQAQYYRLLLNDSIFQDPPNPEVAQRVEDEIRGFIRIRMGVLVGMGAPEQGKKGLSLTQDEIRVLRELATPEIVQTVKALVSKLLKKPSIMESRPAPRAPLEEPKLQPKVVKTPSLKKVTNPKVKVIEPPREVEQRPEARVMTSPRTVGKKGQQKRIVQTVRKEDGTIFEQDLTPQARPAGGVQPIPTPRTRDQIEQTMATVSGAHERAALKGLDRQLRSRGDD